MGSSIAGGDLQTLLEAVKSSEVVEDRVRLLKQLDEIDIQEKSDLDLLIQYLIIFWEDFTCLDISQCSLNKAILHLAARYLESDVSECLEQFLFLGTKGNIWCRKHLQMTLMSTEDSLEEHSSFFYLLILDLLKYYAASYSAVARYFGHSNNGLVVTLENFISEQLTLIKDLASEIKRIPNLSSELLKGVQTALDAVIRLCRVYCNGVDWDLYHTKTDDERGDRKEAERGEQAILVTKCTVEKLCELGVAAANDGGNLVSLLNISWKGVVSLLQLGKGALAVKVNITGVIMMLISLASEVLRCAACTWSTSINERVSAVDAKRIFLPVKFYLIQAVRIISQYQSHALSVYKEIVLCVIVILTFRISLSKLEHLRSASEMLAEILEPTSLHLFNSLLRSAQDGKENKLHILDWLFNNESYVASSAGQFTSCSASHDSLDGIFSVSSDAMRNEKMFFLGRIALFLNLLKCAADLEEDINLHIAKKLGWFLDILVEEDVYTAFLVLKVPSADNSSKNQELIYQSMFSAVLHALKTFTVIVSSSMAWDEVEAFLVEKLYHPHLLCWEIVIELWCFILRHAETDLVNDVIDKLCSLLRLASPDSVASPDSALRRTARIICLVVTHGPDFMADKVYSLIFDHESECLSNVLAALLIEGFPLNRLSDKNRSIAKQRILTQYLEFLESIGEKSAGDSGSGAYGAPATALCSALQSLQVSLSDTELKTLKFLVATIQKYKTSTDSRMKDNYSMLLGELLGIISNMKHLYSFDEIEEVILELQKLFVSKPAISDGHLFLCKPNLASFLAGLGHAELSNSDDSPKTLAGIELYHLLLRERHWAFVHLATAAFGDFVAKTSCIELRRFIPDNAALSFDMDSGNEVDEERFISELRILLEKERACPMMQASFDQLNALVKDGQILKETFQNSLKIPEEDAPCDVMEIDVEKQPNRKRKFPDGICKGVELLRSGMKSIVDGLSQWQQNQYESIEVHDMFLSHFSRLEDVIAHLVSIADCG